MSDGINLDLDIGTSVVVDAPLPIAVDAVTVYGVADTVRRFFFNDSLEWLVQHNMGTRAFVERTTTVDGERFMAFVKVLDENSFLVRLTEAKSGYVDVIFDTSGSAILYG